MWYSITSSCSSVVRAIVLWAIGRGFDPHQEHFITFYFFSKEKDKKKYYPKLYYPLFYSFFSFVVAPTNRFILCRSFRCTSTINFETKHPPVTIFPSRWHPHPRLWSIPMNLIFKNRFKRFVRILDQCPTHFHDVVNPRLLGNHPLFFTDRIRNVSAATIPRIRT